ncbi:MULTISPECIES: nitrogenase iron-molybdenum cofactor biosynthesis protein NifE [Nostocales]|uniref:Nitrogenase iron-molybdenum cofactor biosynthesis protein NifE n=3 Tax=Nostocales TaxID=1161 RepID=A0A0C1QMI2_9CYAN|nr:nitrogenase iron-molybdenum cofactor biosynthesis protein NifE [Tolypothrix bouteillei]KAF3889916.1 nitrogenase iron-molybdenum cofactor biosynthesis protein NifE [Tolypothrix bouteillei VB521301]
MKISQGEINDLPDRSSYQGDRQTCQASYHVRENCTFEGAMFALVPIVDAAHVIHGPSGCTINCWHNGASLSSGSMLYQVRFTTDMDESDIIFGGAKKLYKAILEIERRYKPSAVFVYSTCVSALIGDDLDGACKAASEQTRIPVISVDSPGFFGSKHLGIRLAAEALLEKVIGTAEPSSTTPYDINLIGEYNIAGGMWNIVPILERLGIKVLAKITGDARYKEICYAHRAKLNVISCGSGWLKMARKMEERFGIPYIEASFYGVENVNKSLRDIAAKLNDPGLQERTENLILQETAAIDKNLAPYRTYFQDKRIVIYPQGAKSWSIISVLLKLGVEVIAIAHQKVSQEDKARTRELLGKDSIILEQEYSQEILQIIQKSKADMFIASDRYQEVALTATIPFFNISRAFYQSYESYAGILEVARELYKTFTNPIWKQVRKFAPWEGRKGKEE